MSLWNMFDWIANRVGQNNESLQNQDTGYMGPQNVDYTGGTPGGVVNISDETPSTADGEFGTGLRNIVKNISELEGEDISWLDKNRLKKQLREDFKGEDIGDIPGSLRGPIGKAWHALTKGREKLGGESILGTMTPSGQEGPTEGGPVGQSEALGMNVPQYRSSINLNPIQSAANMPSHRDFMARLMASIKGVR